MNEEQKQFREQMEVRIVALLLGEASAFETAEIEEAMRKDPELAAFHAEMRRTIDLTAEATKHFQAPGQPISHQPGLTPERRARLFAKFKEGKVVAVPISRPARRRRGWLVPASIAAGVLVLGAVSGLVLLLPKFSGRVAKEDIAELRGLISLDPAAENIPPQERLSKASKPEPTNLTTNFFSSVTVAYSSQNGAAQLTRPSAMPMPSPAPVQAGTPLLIATAPPTDPGSLPSPPPASPKVYLPQGQSLSELENKLRPDVDFVTTDPQFAQAGDKAGKPVPMSGPAASEPLSGLGFGRGAPIRAFYDDEKPLTLGEKSNKQVQDSREKPAEAAKTIELFAGVEPRDRKKVVDEAEVRKLVQPQLVQPKFVAPRPAERGRFGDVNSDAIDAELSRPSGPADKLSLLGGAVGTEASPEGNRRAIADSKPVGGSKDEWATAPVSIASGYSHDLALQSVDSPTSGAAPGKMNFWWKVSPDGSEQLRLNNAPNGQIGGGFGSGRAAGNKAGLQDLDSDGRTSLKHEGPVGGPAKIASSNYAIDAVQDGLWTVNSTNSWGATFSEGGGGFQSFLNNKGPRFFNGTAVDSKDSLSQSARNDFDAVVTSGLTSPSTPPAGPDASGLGSMAAATPAIQYRVGTNVNLARNGRKTEDQPTTIDSYAPIAIAAGAYHSLALRPDGSVSAWKFAEKSAVAGGGAGAPRSEKESKHPPAFDDENGIAPAPAPAATPSLPALDNVDNIVTEGLEQQKRLTAGQPARGDMGGPAGPSASAPSRRFYRLAMPGVVEAESAQIANPAPIQEMSKRSATNIELVELNVLRSRYSQGLVPAETLKMKEASLSQLLDAYQDLSGVSVIRPNTLPDDKITIDGENGVSRREAVQVLKKTLDLTGIMMIPQGTAFVKAVPTGHAGTEAPLFTDGLRPLDKASQHYSGTNTVKLSDGSAASFTGTGGVVSVKLTGITSLNGRQPKAILEIADDASDKAKKDAAPAKKPAPPAAPTPQPEINTRENAFSTFSLNVSDVSFKLAASSLEKNVMPEPASIRVEEFVNAFNYHDPAPQSGARLAFTWERAHYPFAHNRDMLRFSIQTAAHGREAQKPLNLVILLDTSGSMERADRVQIIREAMKVLARQLQPQDRISVVAFARTARLWVDGMAGGNPDAFLGKVLELNPDGGTNLEEALGLGYTTAARHFMANGINRVILLTDGAANLGNVEPEALKQMVVTNRIKGIAMDCFGIGWEGYNDDLLEVLSHNGDGRYGFLDRPEEAAPEFANQLAGALNVEAADVKTQVEFNPARVANWRQIGYAKHQLTKEQFRDNTVDAAELAASESGNALYAIEANAEGKGPIGVVRVRYKIPATGEYVEQAWTIPYQTKAPALDEASPAMRLAVTASAFGEWLSRSPFSGEVTPGALQPYLNNVCETYAPDSRPQRLVGMLRQAQAIGGK